MAKRQPAVSIYTVWKAPPSPSPAACYCCGKIISGRAARDWMCIRSRAAYRGVSVAGRTDLFELLSALTDRLALAPNQVLSVPGRYRVADGVRLAEHVQELVLGEPVSSAE